MSGSTVRTGAIVFDINSFIRITQGGLDIRAADPYPAHLVVYLLLVDPNIFCTH